MSQHCDIHATRRRQRAGNVEGMTSNRTITASLIALTALLAVSLSACSVAVTDPGSTTPPPGSPSPTDAPDDSDGPINGGAFTDGECELDDFEVVDDASTVLLSGHCGVVSITASGATITLEDADTVNVFGLDNVIIVNGEVGAITIDGDRTSYTGDSVGSVKVQSNDNTVQLGTADEVRVLGNTNFVQWSHGVASAEDSGTGNTIVAASGD